jgi:hypothetical protein
MNNTLRTISIVVLVLLAGLGLFLGGMYVAGARNGYGPGMMGGSWYNSPNTGNYAYGPGGMMGGGGYSPGPMMGSRGTDNTDVISVADAEKAVQAYLAQTGSDDLVIKEIMIFDNGGYALIAEKSTGIGAFELLIDPVSLTAYPEYGPNMMWNLKYGMMSGNAGSGRGGMMGGNGGSGRGNGMMGRWSGNNTPAADVSAAMPVSASDAAKFAQEYLDASLPGAKVSDEITTFYGYYTIDVERDGKIIGMLSVNGYTGQVFYHTWHGDFVEMKEE